MTFAQGIDALMFKKKKIRFDINGSTEFLSTQMRTSLANLLQTSMWKCHARK